MVATEVAMSMVTDPSRPTRGEVEGLSSAVRNGAEAIMLGKETSAPEHADEVIRQVAQIIKAVESAELEGAFERMLAGEEAFEDAPPVEVEAPKAVSMTALRVQQTVK